MPCPVREGQSLYVDKPAVVITHLPPELGGAREIEADSGGGGGGVGAPATGGLFTGIMAHSKDRGMSGVRGFLTFTLDRPAVVGITCPKLSYGIPPTTSLRDGLVCLQGVYLLNLQQGREGAPSESIRFSGARDSDCCC